MVWFWLQQSSTRIEFCIICGSFSGHWSKGELCDVSCWMCYIRVLPHCYRLQRSCSYGQENELDSFTNLEAEMVLWRQPIKFCGIVEGNAYREKAVSIASEMLVVKPFCSGFCWFIFILFFSLGLLVSNWWVLFAWTGVALCRGILWFLFFGTMIIVFACTKCIVLL